MRQEAQRTLHLQMCLPADIESCGYHHDNVSVLKKALAEWEKRRFPNESFNWGKGRLNFESQAVRDRRKK